MHNHTNLALPYIRVWNVCVYTNFFLSSAKSNEGMHHEIIPNKKATK